MADLPRGERADGVGRLRLTRRPQRALLGALIALVAVGAGACGGSSPSTTTSPPPARVETPQPLPKVPHRWNPRRNSSIGYAMRIPRGWHVRKREGAVLIRSPDHLVAVTLVADRSPAALEVPIDLFASRATKALRGFKARLEPSKPRPFDGTPLDAVQTLASGKTKSGKISERVTLVVLRRDSLVNYTVAVIKNARQARSAKDRAVALHMIRTLRDHSVKPHPARRSRNRAHGHADKKSSNQSSRSGRSG